MKPRILIQGPDGAGKTTLGVDLADYYQIPYLKFSQSKSVSEALEVTQNVIDNYPYCVIDRIKALDHMIYGALIDGLRFSTDEMSQMVDSLDRLVAPSNAYIIFLHATPEILWQRLTQRGDETYIQFDHLRHIIAYYRYFIGSRRNCLTIDTSHKNSANVFHIAKEWIDHHGISVHFAGPKC